MRKDPLLDNSTLEKPIDKGQVLVNDSVNLCYKLVADLFKSFTDLGFELILGYLNGGFVRGFCLVPGALPMGVLRRSGKVFLPLRG